MSHTQNCGSLKILVVDDLPVNQGLLKIYLEQLGHQTDTADNGEQALKKLRDESFDFCFMDIMMPVMDGIQTTKIIRKEISEKIPIVAVTANMDVDVKEKCLDVGMNDCLPKPINREVLEEVILAHI